MVREIICAYKALVGNTEENRIRGKRRRRWVGKTVMYHEERRCKHVDWNCFAKIKDQWLSSGHIYGHCVPWETKNFVSNWATIGFLKMTGVNQCN
jgi:hypothetical protein